MKTIQDVKKYAESKGLKVAIGHPTEWGIPCNTKRAYSVAVKNNLGFWAEPNRVDAYSISDLIARIDDMAGNA